MAPSPTQPLTLNHKLPEASVSGLALMSGYLLKSANSSNLESIELEGLNIEEGFGVYFGDNGFISKHIKRSDAHTHIYIYIWYPPLSYLPCSWVLWSPLGRTLRTSGFKSSTAVVVPC